MPNKTPKVKEENSFDVFDVSNYFISLSLKNKIDKNVVEGVTNLKLQKILYFAQCAYLSLYNKELFSDEIVAWQYGPVVRSVYHKYSDFVNNTLELPKNYDSSLSVDIKKFLDGIWELFSKYSARELVNITHSHKPWMDAYATGIGSVIDKSVLASYYKGIFKFQEDGESNA
jgi:uncharacterized phage-associated protein